ncbi:MAG: Gfo/Idh/MocA family oxidoreductase [Clostridiales Family XIII bacterium]|jgi:predicted dehydrogenase|nr:Gfo/Idh/MocA family oxidoreductase [Clostridiales Family XIII bacterium]
MGKINVGIIGMKFGKEFVNIYQSHPLVGKVAICQRDPGALARNGEELGIPEQLRFGDFKGIADCDELDAIHVVSPVPEHVEHTLYALGAGKHVACTVPMALSIEDIGRICEAKEKSGKYYMMMETAVYTREYLYVKGLVEKGAFGRIQFVRGSHMQDMGLEGWAEYWLGLPPFFYGTHAIAPLLMINKAAAEYVVGHGSGRLSDDLARRYGSPFAVETVTIKLKGSDVVAEATRSLYETVRQYRESFDLYGTKMAFEWDQIADEGQVLFEGGESARRFTAPDTDGLLIDELKRFTKRDEVLDKDNPSFIQGAGHGGSHPHLVHEFVSAIAEGREPALNAGVAANITAAGICGHESCMKGGEKIYIPVF